ncbi:MAG: PspC domain-containing protein [Ruminococcus sp.]|jgi:phage shock protein C|nr:PspC domain-containing protein [Ruminococcus sp.]
MKKLMKSQTNKTICGICAGFANYYNVDPVLVKAIYAAATIITGFIPGIIAYLVLAVIIPYEQ